MKKLLNYLSKKMLKYIKLICMLIANTWKLITLKSTLSKLNFFFTLSYKLNDN